jgi:hypothetical protein
MVCNGETSLEFAGVMGYGDATGGFVDGARGRRRGREAIETL